MSKQSERQKRYRTREKIRAQATFARAVEIELAWFGVNRDGEHMAFDTEGNLIDLVVGAAHSVAETAPQPKPKKLYAPASWEPSKWNRIVDDIRADDRFTREIVIENLTKSTTLSAKQIAQARKIVESLPDTPDWRDYLPLADESGS